jgi:hypothetical protein
LNGLRVVSFESRRSAELAELIRNYGGEPLQAPSMREVPLIDQREALAFGETLLTGDWDVLILLTGVGTRMLLAACATRWPLAKGRGGEGAGTAHTGLPRAQTNRRAQGSWPRAGAESQPEVYVSDGPGAGASVADRQRLLPKVRLAADEV